MSTQFGDSDPTRYSYTITSVHGCKVFQGMVPLDELVALMDVWNLRGESWICDALLSQALGVNMVCGPCEATDAWRLKLGLRLTTEKPKETT